MLRILGETKEEHRARMRDTPLPFCRLRYFGPDDWSVAFFTYSHEKYEPSLFPSGKWYDTPEKAFHVGAKYLG